MGLLRSAADAVLFGSGSLHAAHGHLRIPEFVYSQAKDLFVELRRRLGRPPWPLNVVLTASGNINLDEPKFHTPGLRTVVITTDGGALRLVSKRADKLSGIAVRSTGEAISTTPTAILKILASEFGVRLLLHEGGAIVFGLFLGKDGRRAVSDTCTANRWPPKQLAAAKPSGRIILPPGDCTLGSA
jgi:riboflavin biosynthesis pyrimidine reductase